VVAYQTAYFKANHPVEFMAALLTSEMGDTDKIVKYMEECRAMGLQVLPPDVNVSGVQFTVVGGTMRFGLAAIKNVGEGAVEAILDARAKGAPFRSLFDLCERADMRAVNRRVVESFIKSGSLDSVDGRRAALFAAIDRAMEAGAQHQRDREQGQSSLFGAPVGQETAGGPSDRIADTSAWTEAERLSHEKESLGFFISGHPLERFREELAKWVTCTTAELGERADAAEVTVGGIITGLRLIKTRKGDRMASFVLEDLAGGVDALVFPETYKKTAARLADDELVLVKGRAETLDEGKARMLVSEVLPLEQAKLAAARYVTIRVPLAEWDRGKGERLRDILGSHRGDCPVTLEMVRPGVYAVALAPGAQYRVRPDAVLREEVEALLGPGALVLSRSNGPRHHA
jgi:DNA polymerase-3 subunit alpha